MEKKAFPLKKRYRVFLAYDGTSYSGWQKQGKLKTIQGTLEESFSKILREEIFIIGASRTDAGVHAFCQVAHFDTTSLLPIKTLFYSINCLLPKEIKVLSLEQVPPSFHARYGAKKKTYHYYLEMAPFASPFSHAYSIPIYHHFDLSLLEKGCSFFVGKQDFSSFTNQAQKGAAKKNPIRTIYKIQICSYEKGIYLLFEGDGFLYKMIRNIMGTLLLVGKGKYPPEKIPELLSLKDRKKAPATAAAKALFLVKVNYETPQTSYQKESDVDRQNDKNPLLFL